MYSIILCTLLVIAGCGDKEVRQFRVVDPVTDTVLTLKGEQAAIGTIYDADFVIVGGSLGGLTAAFAACAAGRKTILIEETNQLAACFADTNSYFDSRLQRTTGSSLRIRQFRDAIRNWYRKTGRQMPVRESPVFRQLDDFRDGAFCFETDAALAAVDSILADYQRRGRLVVLTRYKVAEVIPYGKRVSSVNVVDLEGEQVHQVRGWMTIDATETGELLPLAGIAFHIGATPADSAASYDIRYFEDTLADTDNGLSRVPLLTEPPAGDVPFGTVSLPRVPRRLAGWYEVSRDDIAAETAKGPRARFFDDAVGIGYSPIIVDHGGRQEIIPTRPFQIPLRAMIPREYTNFLVAGRAFGAGPRAASAYQAPSVLMAIGEAAGVVAEFCAGNTISTEELLGDKQQLRALQDYLVERRGVPIYWYDNVRPDDERFKRAQRMPFNDPGRRGRPSLSFPPPGAD